MPEDRVAVFEVKKYMIIWRQRERRNFSGTEAIIRSIVRCLGEEYTMDVFFLTEDSPMPDPIISLNKKKAAIFLNIGDMLAFVDTLRNEAPIFGHLRADRPEWTSITTTEEPVGVGDEGFI